MTYHVRVNTIDPDDYEDDHDKKIADALLQFNRHIYNGGNHCVNVVKIIMKVMDNNCIPSEKLLSTFYSLVHKSFKLSGVHYLDVIKGLTNRLFIDRLINCYVLPQVLDVPQLDGCFEHFTNITYDDLSDINHGRFIRSHDDDNDHELIKHVINNAALNDKSIKELFHGTNTKIFELLILKLGDKVHEYFEQACISLPYSKSMMEIILKKDRVISKHVILNILDNGNCQSLICLLDKTKIEVKREHFRRVMSTCDQENKMNLLIERGYKPDMDDVKLGITCCVEIPDIDRFNIVLDKGVFEFCVLHRFFPHYTFVGVNPNIADIFRTCCVGKLCEIKKLLKNGYVPTEWEMEMFALCRVSNKIFGILLQACETITFKCIENRFGIRCPHAFKVVKCFVENVNDEIKMKSDLISKIKSNVMFDYSKTKLLINKEMEIENDVVKNMFGVNNGIIFDDLKMFLWNKMITESWLKKGYIDIPDSLKKYFGLNNDHVVKITDFEYMVCAFINITHHNS